MLLFICTKYNLLPPKNLAKIEISIEIKDFAYHTL